MGTRAEIVERLGKALAELCADPAPLAAMSRRCARRAREQFTWSAKAERIVELYRWLLDARRPRPEFPMPVPDLAEAT
jgi:glycosyltransferase involved in cell wall biosynthesis